ncbi:hypothetical protein CLONEX_03499 [[Clostridium] nexile DSM 1787]|nr:hypothetical protein CLONEX_03499 [[Clostridium] nexile DSM 1787]
MVYIGTYMTPFWFDKMVFGMYKIQGNLSPGILLYQNSKRNAESICLSIASLVKYGKMIL